MTRPRTVARTCLAASIVLAAGAAAGAPLLSAAGAPGTAANPVKAKAAARNGYVPVRLVVRPRQKVWFVSVDRLPHTATAYKRVKGKPVFDNAPSAGTFTIRAPKAAGTYRYFCLVHPYQKGVLEVRTG